MSGFWRTIIIYFVVLAALRLMGKRELAQLSPFDLVVAIIIAELAALPMEEKNIPLWEAFVPIGVVVLLEIALSFIALKSAWARGLIYGSPTVVIAHGKIIDGNMRKLRYNTNDLLAQLRDKGFFDIAGIEYAVMEVPGTLSIIPKASNRPVTPADLGFTPVQEEIPTPVILDGIIHKRNLKDLGKDSGWVETMLKDHNLQANQVFLATYTSNSGFRIISKKGEAVPPLLNHIQN